MLRVAVPYGELNSAQLRVLARIAREFDRPDEALFQAAQTKQDAIGGIPAPALSYGYAHFTTRQNLQYNWIPLEKSADVMDLLASVNMHGIQTSGNCIRNITADERAGVAVDEIVDPRAFAEILRQWSTLHPEFAFLPRKFKIAISGAEEDRAATAWHDVGLQVHRNAAGDVGFRVMVGGGMGRTPIIGTVIREFLPWDQILNFLEAVIRVYNLFGRRDNTYKARIKILVKAEGQNYIDQVEAEYQRIVTQDGAPHTITQAELDRMTASFVPPSLADKTHLSAEEVLTQLNQAADADKNFARWLQQNVAPHRNPHLRVVTLSFKRLGQAPGDATADQLDASAQLADQFSAGEARVSHDQNLGGGRPIASALPSRESLGLGQTQYPHVDRHDRLPGWRLLRFGECAFLAPGRCHHRALPRPRRIVRPGRNRFAHQRLHQLVRPPPQRPHRHLGRG
jgi:sulfite reductase (NADPH) hemoprotein beta-component